jgi:class 3 adenylate cyclase
MALVERFIEINGWTTSRKTALLSGLAFLAFLFGSSVVEVFFWLGGPELAATLDEPLAKRLLWSWTVFLATCCLVSWIPAQRGREGRWTFFVLVIPFGAFAAAGVYLFGGMSSSAFAVFPMVVLLVALWFGPRGAWFGFGYGLVLSAVVFYVQTRDDVPFAPIFIDRDLDAQSNPILVGALFGAFMMFFVFCFGLVVLTLLARASIQANLDRATGLIRRYLPSQHADRILSGEHSEESKPERIRLTMFFSDVEGFTDASDQLDAEDLAAVLNEYLSEMSVIAERFGATIDQFVGDGIMIFIGAPHATSDKDHALRAVRMALEMQRRMLELKDVWAERGIRKPFRARIGINTGYASVGDFGSEGRKVYSAIGLQVNIAARIQSHCEPGRILISDTTWALVNDEIPCTDKGELMLKGVHYPVRVYEVEA